MEINVKNKYSISFIRAFWDIYKYFILGTSPIIGGVLITYFLSFNLTLAILAVPITTLVMLVIVGIVLAISNILDTIKHYRTTGKMPEPQYSAIYPF